VFLHAGPHPQRSPALVLKDARLPRVEDVRTVRSSIAFQVSMGVLSSQIRSKPRLYQSFWEWIVPLPGKPRSAVSTAGPQPFYSRKVPASEVLVTMSPFGSGRPWTIRLHHTDQ
jgi:hypothetical protein